MLSLDLTCRRPTCDVVIGCNWQRSVTCPSGSPALLRWVADILKFARNANRIAQFSTISPLNMVRIVLMKNAVTADDVHIKYIHRRQPPACMRSWTQFNSAGKPAANAWDRLSLGDKCSHMRSVVSGRAGGYAPGVSAAYVNQALLGERQARIKCSKRSRFMHRQPKLTKRGVILFNIYANVQRVTYLPTTSTSTRETWPSPCTPAAYGGVVLQRFEFSYRSFSRDVITF